MFARRSASLGGWAACAVVVLALALASGGCAGVVTPSGETVTETREVTSFDSVSLTGIGTLTIKPGSTASLTVKADKNLMPFIKTEVVGSELEISINAGARILKWGGSDDPVYELTAPSIIGITNTGSGTIEGGPFSGGSFTIDDTGSGAIDLGDVDVLSLNTEITGSGKVSIGGGVTGAQVVEVSGSGSFEAPDLESKVATVRVSGSGSVELWATEGLDANVSGSGGVSYWGTPRITEESSGSGKITSLGDKPSTTSN